MMTMIGRQEQLQHDMAVMRNIQERTFAHSTSMLQSLEALVGNLVNAYQITNPHAFFPYTGQQGNMVAPLPPAGNLQLEVLPPLPPINISDLRGIDRTNYMGNYIPTEEPDPFQLFPIAGDFGGSSQVLDPHMFGDLGIVPESMA